MAVPSVPEASNIKHFADLTTTRIVQSDDPVVVFPSIELEVPNDNGYIVYPEGVLPSSLSTPFVRIRFKLEGLPVEAISSRIGIMTNCKPLDEDGFFYGMLFVSSGGSFLEFESGPVAYNADPIVPTVVDMDIVDAVDWSYLTGWCYMDIHFGALTVTIYIYDSTGTLKATGVVDKQSSQIGTVGLFLQDFELGSINPHIDDFYVNNESPYD